MQRALGRWWRRSAPAGLALVVGVGICLGLAAWVARVERTDRDATLDAVLRSTQAQVSTDLRVYENVLLDLAAAVAADNLVTPEQLSLLTSQVKRDRFPSAGALFFASNLTGAPEVTFEKTITQPPSALPQQISPDRAALTSPEALQAMGTAGLSGQVVSSQVVSDQGVSDQGVSDQGVSDQGVSGQTAAVPSAICFVLAGPVYTNPATAATTPADPFSPPGEAAEGSDAASGTGAPVSTTGGPSPQGWMLLTLRTEGFLSESLVHLDPRIAGLSLVSADRASRPATVLGSPVYSGGTIRNTEVVLGQRVLRLVVTFAPRFGARTPASTATLVFWGGAAISALLASGIWMITGLRQRISARLARIVRSTRADMAAQRATEQRLLAREAELSGFVAVAAHDLRTPLTNVAAYADLLAELASEDLDPTCLGFVERISSGTRRMTRLINDLLDFTTAENAPLHLQPVNLRALASEVVAEHTTHLGDVSPTVDIGSLPTLPGDPEPLRRLLDNLVGNAIKYVRHGDTAKIMITGQEELDFWRIWVADRGIGIPDEESGAIFAAFHRDRAAEGYPGTGLGLAICKRIVARHGGQIGVEPNPGGGSRFWFTIPKVPASGKDGGPFPGSATPDMTLSPAS